MPAPIVTAAVVTALLKGLGHVFGQKGKKKREAEQRRATVATKTTRQKMAEDARRSRVRAGASLLGGVPATTAGGAVNTNVGLDPALVADLEKERTYDFESTEPKAGVGATWDFLDGLFGDAGDVVTRAYGTDPVAAAAAPRGGVLPGSPSSPLTPPGGITRTPWVDDALSIEDLLKLGDKTRVRGNPNALDDEGIM